MVDSRPTIARVDGWLIHGLGSATGNKFQRPPPHTQHFGSTQTDTYMLMMSRNRSHNSHLHEEQHHNKVIKGIGKRFGENFTLNGLKIQKILARSLPTILEIRQLKPLI